MSLDVPTEFILGLLAGTVLLNIVFQISRQFEIVRTEKQQSWILTFTTCIVVMTLSSRYYIPVILNGLDISKIRLSDTMSLAILGFFFSYLLWDLILGLWYYKSMITWLTGYIHHVFYIGLCMYIVSKNVSALFCLMFYNEIPTLVLALGSISKNWRSNIGFIVLFFCTRILMHSLFAWKFYWYMPERAFVWRISVLVLPMHLCWFCGALGQLGKPKKNTEK